MPLPKEPLTIHGGCNCGAIRYKISIPAFEDRPIHYCSPASTASDPATPRLPCVITDHCNDCRASRGDMLSMWLQTPADMFSISCLSRSSTAFSTDPDTNLIFPEDATMPRLRLAPDEDEPSSSRPPYIPGHTIVSGRDASARDTWLSWYIPRYDPGGDVPRIVRSFCSRCGTNLFYVADPAPFGWAPLVDVILGTLDREDLEKEHMRPERQLWWSLGIPWVQEMASGLDGGKHPLWNINETVEE